MSPVPHEEVRAYLSAQRWFAGKGRDFAVTDVRRVATLAPFEAGSPTVTVELVDVRAEDGEETTYQLPLAHYPELEERLNHAHVSSWTDDEVGATHAYDATHDRAAMATYLRAFDAAAEKDGSGGTWSAGALVFHRLPGHDLDTEVHSALFSGEQSNSSVAFGDDSLLKLFRKITPGVNPDIDIHRVLTEAGNRNVAALYGWLAADHTHLAMLQEFLRTATDGWELALSSVRNLFAEADLHADEVGGDFDGESHRLGHAIAEVHLLLGEHFPTGSLDTAATAAAMQDRLVRAVADAPELAPYQSGLAGIFAQVAEVTGDVPCQRVHGDLHLGQTLRTSLGWKLVDFEGEPAKKLAERILPDSPWRDVAGMLRSFDYAARSVAKDATGSEDEVHQRDYRGNEWVVRNQRALLAGYTELVGEPTATDLTLVRAYEADKAVYEVLYEARNRPGWIDIPLGAIARLTTEEEL